MPATGPPAHRPERAAAIYLRYLLQAVDAYKATWLIRAVQRKDSGLHQAAIARVIRDWIDRTGESSEFVDERQLASRVSRALRGTSFSTETLHWFIQAFGMRRDHADTLTRTLMGRSDWGSEEIPAVVLGNYEFELEHRAPLAYEVRCAVDRHVLDHRGIPTSHRTLLQLKSLQDGLAYYPWVIDTTEVTGVEAYGAAVSDLIPFGESNLQRIDFVFPRPVSRDQMVSFEYELTFTYGEPPEMMFVRQCRRPVQNLDMVVRFDRGRLPVQVEWIGGTLGNPEPAQAIEVELDDANAVHTLHEYVAGAYVGFRWRFT